MFKKKHSNEALTNSHDTEKINEFLQNMYLTHEYIVPEFIHQALGDLAASLSHMPGFEGLVNVGGTANGSLALRMLYKENPATDLDFYLIGDARLNRAAAAALVRTRMAAIHIPIDGEINGIRADNYLDLSHLDALIERGDAALLALPFQSFYGPDKNVTQRRVLEAVLAREDSQEVWDEVANFHAQSLSLHHGSFEYDLAQRIVDDYYPAKVEKFQLPLTPQEAYEQVLSQF